MDVPHFCAQTFLRPMNECTATDHVIFSWCIYISFHGNLLPLAWIWVVIPHSLIRASLDTGGGQPVGWACFWVSWSWFHLGSTDVTGSPSCYQGIDKAKGTQVDIQSEGKASSDCTTMYKILWKSPDHMTLLGLWYSLWQKLRLMMWQNVSNYLCLNTGGAFDCAWLLWWSAVKYQKMQHNLVL